ncbi:MAG: glycosyltransferase family 4 protein [Chloroflexota bacterium]
MTTGIRDCSIALIGSYLPRHCGIATFTSDLATAMANETSQGRVQVVAINDAPGGYRYQPEVHFEINQSQLADYRLAAEFLNMSRVDVVYVQHEYGIFGGQDGDHIIKLLRSLRMPVITTLHTILKEPTPSQHRVIGDLATVSDRVVIMSETGARFLRDIYQIPNHKIEYIPHGVPDTPFVDPNYYKDQFGVEGKKVILTFGLLSPNKGVENVIQALPKVISAHPDVVYLVLGATHPHVKRTQGESYRLQLQQLATRIGVDDHVVFHNRFVELNELSEFLGAADLYATPYRNEAQTVSGTLSYAMSSGKAVISTPYWYASEMLAAGRGRIVPFDDPTAMATEIIDLLTDDVERHAIRKRAYIHCRSHVWREVAKRYLEVFDQVRQERQVAPRRTFQAPTVRTTTMALPEIRLDHMARLTDDVGILQHAIYSVPDRAHGYCTDDNARALVVATLARPYYSDVQSLDRLTDRYISFLQHAFSPEAAVFRNLLGYDRRWLEEEGSQDSQGRALWALGVAASSSDDERLRAVAAVLFRQAIPTAERLSSPRAVAFALLGVDNYMQRLPGDSSAKRLREVLAERLMCAFAPDNGGNWQWPDTLVTYSNASLPHALISAGQWLGRRDMVETGLDVLRWLLSLQTVDGHFVPIGNDGWCGRDGSRRARFDQQPIEADTTIGACVEAFRITGDREWLGEAMHSFRWFLGDNDLGVPVYDEATGAGFDGLEATGLNQNQGAESTLAWLHALIQMHALQAEGLLEMPQDSLRGQESSRSVEPSGLIHSVPSRSIT